MKTLDQLYSIGELIEVDIVKPKLGNCPIGKLNNNITCIFEKTFNHLIIGTVINAKIVKINKTHLVVKYVSLAKSLEDIKIGYQQKLAEFKERGFKSGSVILNS